MARLYLENKRYSISQYSIHKPAKVYKYVVLVSIMVYARTYCHPDTVPRDLEENPIGHRTEA